MLLEEESAEASGSHQQLQRLPSPSINLPTTIIPSYFNSWGQFPDIICLFTVLIPCLFY